MTDPVELLRRLQVSLVSGYMPADVARWLSQGVDAYLDGQPLDAALDLKSAPGKRNHASVLRLAERDELIRRAARNMDGSAWQQAGVLVQAIQDLDALEASGINLKDHRNRVLIPKSLGGSRLTYLAEIRRCGMELPNSQSQFHRILSNRRD